jgi:hypothetical protein
VTVLRVPTSVLRAARAFFEEQGSFGLEGTAMIAGPDHPRLVIPDQNAVRTQHGVSVELTAKGQFDLATGLAGSERFVARIHSHPGEAFHSATDDRNPVITFDGALSIVVPFFGLGLRHGLGACAVYLREEGRWHSLPTGDQRDRWVVTGATSVHESEGGEYAEQPDTSMASARTGDAGDHHV